MLSKYTKHSKSVCEVEYYYDEIFKYLKSEPEESTAERVKLNPQNKTGTGLKILTPNKLLMKLPVLLTQIKAGNNSNKLKNEIRQILYVLYQHNKIIKKLYNNLIKSL